MLINHFIILLVSYMCLSQYSKKQYMYTEVVYFPLHITLQDSIVFGEKLNKCKVFTFLLSQIYLVFRNYHSLSKTF